MKTAKSCIGLWEVSDPEFKAILEKALNPKTSFAGMNKRYEAENGVLNFDDYADIKCCRSRW